MMTASPNRCYSEHHKATEEEGDQGILGKEIWRNVDSRIQVQLEKEWSRQHKTEVDGDKWSMAYVPCSIGSNKA